MDTRAINLRLGDAVDLSRDHPEPKAGERKQPYIAHVTALRSGGSQVLAELEDINGLPCFREWDKHEPVNVRDYERRD